MDNKSKLYWAFDQEWYDEKASDHISKLAFEDMVPEYEDTKLLDHRGRKLYRKNEKQRIGFW